MARRITLFAVLLLLVASLISGCSSQAGQAPTASQPSQTTTDKAPAAEPAPSATAPTMKLTVYYPDKEAAHLVPEIREVPKDSHPARTAILQLLEDPKNHDLVRVLPQGMKLLDISIKDHIAYANFDDKLVKTHMGSAAEMMIVGSIVDTLTEFTDIQKVQILVNGKPVDTLAGHMDTSEPLSRSEQIIKK